MKKWIIPVLLSGVFILACKKSSTNTNQLCGYDPCVIKAPDAEVQKYKDTLTAHNIPTSNLIQQCSGLLYQIIDTGKGAKATACSTVTLSYTGYFNDSTGASFESSSFRSNLSYLIFGFLDGVPLIREGGHIKLFIPPTLGYGSASYGNIPGNSNLYFDVNLTKVE
jgi:FKBP-type peptidyl-prolyl cis-trans isomerase FkpA